METTKYRTPKPNAFMRFFWNAAGADKWLLERSTFSDQIKYFCLGGIVLATGLLAGLAGGYAFYTIFEPKGSALDSAFHLPTMLKALLFGSIWGLIIFNIDRFIVTSTGKGDGTEAITFQELKSAVPRIIMGTIIAMTISKPIEIRMFKTEIDAELHARQLEQQAAYKKRIEANNQGFVVSKEKEISRMRQEFQAKQKQLDDLNIELQSEIQGRTKSGKTGDGPAANAIRLNIARVETEFAELKKRNSEEIQKTQQEKEAWETKIKQELAQSEKVAAGLDGLLERIKISHEIAGFWISLFITLLFMAIELTPIFFKLMLIKGPYDYLEDNIKESIKAENGIYVQYNYHKDGNGQERDLVTFLQSKDQIEEQLSLAQVKAELRQYALERYREAEMRRIDADLTTYIQEEPSLTDDRVGQFNVSKPRELTPEVSQETYQNSHYHVQ